MSHITAAERHTIEVLLQQGQSRIIIAAALKRHKSVIYREINRNCDQRSGEYRHELADKKAQKNKSEKPTRSDLTESMKAHIQQRLQSQHSPEQIHGICRNENIPMVSVPTIYAYLKLDRKRKGMLYKQLRHRGKKRRKLKQTKEKRGKIPGRIGIEARPEIVAQKQRLGDLEIDLVIGDNHQGNLLTINDRVSGKAWLRLVTNKKPEIINHALHEALTPHQNHLHTITSDNGKEFAGHLDIAKTLDIDYYFADPYCSWQRGANENLNGLIRQYIPKGTNIAELSPSYIKEIEDKLNNRPRKRHNYLTPNQIHQNLTSNNSVALTS